MGKKKLKQYEEALEEVDGSTLEKRREQRAEILEEFVGGLEPEDRQGIVGTVNQYQRATGVQVVPAEQSLYELRQPTGMPLLTLEKKKLRDLQAQGIFREEDLPPVVKRTPDQRINSMVKRLQSAPPETVEPILKDIANEYWKAGAPVTVDALRAVASHFLNQAERRK